MGFYEQDCRTWGMDGIDPNFTNALCPDDLDRVMDVLEGAFARMPALRDVGIHTIVNGPITYTIDGTPLVGPIPGKRNAYCIIGLRAGLGEGGGHGWLLAQQIVHGEACYDTWPLDPRRFGPHTNVELCAKMAIQDYQNEFRFHFPNEHRPAARMARTTPLTPVLEAEGAHFAPINGWERAEVFAPGLHVTPTFRFDESFPIVAAEVEAVHTAVGLAEVNGFNRIEITGKDRHVFLDRLCCGTVPKRDGRLGLGYLLNHQGMIKCEATFANLPASDRGPARLWYGSAAASERHDLDWLTQQRRAGEDVTFTSLTSDHAILLLAGPKARAVLSAAARGDWSNTAFPWRSVRETFVGIAPATVMSVSYSGELAYEIHVPLPSLYAAYTALRAAGEAYDLRLFGSHAVESMRLEKGFLHWKADLLTEFDPFETGLNRFVKMDKAFIGKTALEARHADVPRKRLVTLRVACDDRPAAPGASMMVDGRVVGTVTSGAWGHRTGLNLAMGFVDPAFSAPGTQMTLDLLGDQVPADVIPPSPFDPDMTRPRG